MTRDRKPSPRGAGNVGADAGDGPTSLMARGRAAKAAQRLKARKDDQEKAGGDEKKAAGGGKESEAEREKKEDEAFSVLQGLANLSQGMDASHFQISPEYMDTIGLVLEAKSFDDGKHGREVWNMIDVLSQRLAPLIAIAKQSSASNVRELAAGWEADFAQMRERSQESRAKERVANSMEIDGKVVEDVDMPKGERQALALKLPSIRESLFNMVSQGAGITAGADPLTLSKLSMGMRTLTMVGDALSLDDEELWAKIEHGEFNGIFDGISSVSDFVSKVLKATQDVLVVGLKAGGAIAAKLGKTNLAANCSLLSDSVLSGLGPVLEGIDFVHNIIGLFSPDSSVQERVDGFVGAASTIGQKVVEKTVTNAATDEAAVEAATSSGDTTLAEGFEAGAEQTGKAVGGALFGSIAINYEMIKILGASYMNTRFEIASTILDAYPAISKDAEQIGSSLDRLAKAKLLEEKETDPKQKALLAAEAEAAENDLSMHIDFFLDEACYHGQWSEEAEKVRHPGSFPILQRQFASLAPLLARPKPQMNIVAAQMILEKIRYCIEHAKDFVEEDASRPADNPTEWIEMPKYGS